MEHKISIEELENTPSKTLEFHFDEKIKEKSLAALNLIEDILEQAFLFISSA